MSKFYTTRQFAIFRICFGIYLVIHFVSLIPYTKELFGNNGMIPDPSMNPTWAIIPFPNFLVENDLNITIFLGLLSLASLAYASGFCRKTMSIFLWYGWAFLLNRNVLISNPSIPYVGWLLLASIVIPSGEGYYAWNFRKSGKKSWHMPKIIYFGAWFLMALGYTISGIHKLQCPSWTNGSALRLILNSMLANDNWLRNFLLALPPIVLQIHTWVTLISEICFLPLGLFYLVRKWYWILIVCMHIGVILLLDFTDLTFGVLMIHLFTFDNNWLHEFPFIHITKYFKKKIS